MIGGWGEGEGGEGRERRGRRWWWWGGGGRTIDRFRSQNVGLELRRHLHGPRWRNISELALVVVSLRCKAY